MGMGPAYAMVTSLDKGSLVEVSGPEMSLSWSIPSEKPAPEPRP